MITTKYKQYKQDKHMTKRRPSKGEE
jgi:hypothetical protein